VPDAAPQAPPAEPAAWATPVSETLPESAVDHFGEASPSEGAGPPPAGEPYLAQRGGRLFHGRDCGWVARIPEPERAYFKRTVDAREAGLAPCPVCEPWEAA
jgi:hypothetical protein